MSGVTDWNERVDQIRKVSKASNIECMAIGCPKQCDRGQVLCLKHWNYVPRHLRAGIHSDDPAVRENALETIVDIIQRAESRGSG